MRRWILALLVAVACAVQTSAQTIDPNKPIAIAWDHDGGAAFRVFVDGALHKTFSPSELTVAALPAGGHTYSGVIPGLPVGAHVLAVEAFTSSEVSARATLAVTVGAVPVPDPDPDPEPDPDGPPPSLNLRIVGPALPPPPGANVAAAAAGASAIASSFNGSEQRPENSIDGNAASYWGDSSANLWPDWLEVRFRAAYRIGSVRVRSLEHAKLTAFDVQWWDGAEWIVLKTVTANPLADVTVEFEAVRADRIRVVVHAATYRYGRILEIEALTVE